MMKINKKSKEGIKKKIALISLAALILNTAMIGVFAPLGNVLRAEDNLCPVDVDVILVMDRSGSMAWDLPESRLSQAKDAANSFLSNLGTNDQSALVSYASSATLDKELDNSHTDDLPVLSTKVAVNALEAVGGTNIGEAIEKGTAELNASGRSEATKAMILLTDGRATCPVIHSGYPTCGYIEDDGDVTYAKSEADLAASLEYKIYTIGLGDDVNIDLLTYIADITGAQYYPASDGYALEGIYNQISQELCHGSISGCKYVADIDGNINTEEKLSGWVIELNNGNINETQSTVDGCYSFTNLPAGNYTISEGLNENKQPYLQTYPAGLTWDVALNGESVIDQDFGNYFPICGNGIIDINYTNYVDEQCDDGNDIDNDDCSNECLINEEPVYECSDDIDNDGDGYVDYPEDPGCDSSEDNDEYDSPIDEGDVIINELMWAGSASSIADEWIELKNTTQSPIENLNGCKLYKKDGGEIADLAVLNIDIDGYLVISRKTQEDSNIAIIPDLVSSSVSLSNSELEITLYCGETLIDIAGDGEDPLAGYNGSSVIPKKSMSRKAIVADGTLADSWCTAATQENWDAEAEELGTPGEPNVCNFISGYKFNDESNDSVWDEGEPGISGWTIELYDSIDGLINNLIDTATTIVENLGYYKFTNLDEGTYFVQEESQSGWQQTFPASPSYHEVIISEENPISENNNFGNFEEPVPVYQCSDGDDNDDDGLTDSDDPGCHSDGDVNNDDSYEPTDDDEYNEPAPYCGDGTCDANIGENCSTCPQDCGSCGGGGGGVITKPTIIITDEKVVYLGGGEALVTWTTNIETTRQVAYGDDSVTVLGAVPEYGYDSVNGESSDMTKEHSVTIGGLIDGVIYYFRPVADRSGSTGEKVGKEVTYVFKEEGEVKGIVDPITPVECNYLLEYIKLGADNNPVEVKKLETFLNEFEGENLAVNGIYEQVDFDAVSRFQEKYNENVLVPWSHEGSTGYVYITTKKMINELYCQREFPLTPEQESEVSAFSARFLSAPIESGEAFDGDEAADFEVPTAEDIEEGRVGGAETEEGETEETEKLIEFEEEENDYPQEIKIDLGDEGEDEVASSSDYSRYILIVLALIILVLAYRFYNSRKKQKEDIQ